AFKSSQFDLILMDLQMPEMDGYTATRLIRDWEKSESLPSIPIIAVSAHDRPNLTDTAFSSYLIKPISPNQLRGEILKFTKNIKFSSSNQGIPNKAVVNKVVIDQLEKQVSDLKPQYLL